MANEGVVSVFSKVNDDILLNILRRLPAVAFACAACVSRAWNRNCSSILCRPKFVSAMSVNPDPCEAVDEVFDEVFSQPIRPDFAIVYIGMEFSLPFTSFFVFKKVPRGVPIIINQAVGLIGVDAGADEIVEVKWELENGPNYWDEEILMGGNPINGGLILSIGFVPDLKVDVIPLLRSKTQSNMPLMEYFMLELRSYSASVSGSLNPACITMFGDHRVDIRSIVEKIDLVMPEETAVVGDAKGSFLFRRRDQTQNYSADLFFFDAAALVFARDQNKSAELGETRFHVAVADGIIPFGPEVRSVSVFEDFFAQSWISGVVEGVEEGYPMLDCVTVLQQLINQLDLGNPNLYIEVRKGRQYSTQFRTTLACHELLGGNYESIIVKGCGIQPGDRFIFLHSDAGSALTRVDDARHSLEALDANQEVFGGLIFSSYHRDRSFFGASHVDITPFTDKLSGVPMAGISCTREIGRRALLGPGLGYCLHAHSCVYLAMSYVPPMSY
ncbi:F-box/LRR-repeat protein [Rosa sericea]